MISEIHLNIGSNSGDRRAFIARAVAALRAAFAPAALRLSRETVSAPWGFSSPEDFINVGLVASVERSAPWTPADLETLLGTVKAIERSISSMPHRRPDGTYADREIDIDIIAVDGVTYSSATLTIPHPHIAVRRFVLEPMAALAPHWRHPLTGLSCRQMLDKL